MTEFAGSERPIQSVREGMTVVDADGEVVGEVDLIRMGDGTDTVDAEGERDSDTWLESFAEAFGAEGPSGQAAERLNRLGYVRVDARGLFSGRRFVEADQIQSVRDDEVHLSVSGDQLIS